MQLVLKTNRDRHEQTVVRKVGATVWFEKADKFSPKGEVVFELEWDLAADNDVGKLWGTSASELLERHSIAHKDGHFNGIAWIPLRESIVKISKYEQEEPAEANGANKRAAKQLLDRLKAACNAAINVEHDGNCNVVAELVGAQSASGIE
jgi:hypothetical protein